MSITEPGGEAAKAKIKGNTAFKAKLYVEARHQYTAAIDLCIASDGGDDIKAIEFVTQCFANRAQCCINLRSFDLALSDSSHGLAIVQAAPAATQVKMAPLVSKLHYRKGLALRKLGQLKEALQSFQEAEKQLKGRVRVSDAVAKEIATVTKELAASGGGGGGGAGSSGSDEARRGALLASSFKCGDVIYYVGARESDGCGCVEYGDAGTVLGSYEADHTRVQCIGFPNYEGLFHVDPEEHILTETAFKAPLPGGLKRGDKVVYVGARVSDTYGVISYGDEGMVVGHYRGNQTKVQVQCNGFPNVAGNLGVVISDLVTDAAFQAPLPGGWKRGDKVVYVGPLYSEANGTVGYGDVGVVLGSCADHTRVQCRFRNYDGLFHVDPKEHILTGAAFKAPLPGGWTRGDRVIYVGARYADADGTVEYGDAGTILGRSKNPLP